MKRIIAIAFIVTLLVVPADASAKRPSYAQLQKQNARLKAKVVSLKKRLRAHQPAHMNASQMWSDITGLGIYIADSCFEGDKYDSSDYSSTGYESWTISWSSGTC